MKLWNRSISIILFMVLAACGPVITPSEPSDTMPAITETYKPTETNTPTVTLTPTITNTPTEANTLTETAIPVPEYYKGIAPDLDSLTLVTPEQKKLIMDYIMAHPQLTAPTDKKNEIIRRTNNMPDGTVGLDSVDYDCASYGETCIPVASIREKNPHGGLDINEVIWEVLDPDGSHKFIDADINGIILNEAKPDTGAKNTLKSILKLQKGNSFEITIEMYFKLPSGDIPDPYALDITNNAPDQQLFVDLKNSAKTGILPEKISRAVVAILMEIYT